MSNLFKLDDMTVQREPAITKWLFEDLCDEPDKHRWRAWWVTDFLGVVTGIELRAYPVIKTNPASVWINEWGVREATKQPWEEGGPAMEWITYEGEPMKKRLLHNGSGSAWAKPTQEEAIQSLAIRLTRWADHVDRDVKRARSAADVLEKLRPNLKMSADAARTRLDGKEWTI